MRILAHVEKAVPLHNAGAEWMLHTILRELVRRGHQAVVGRGMGDWPDVVITHLGATPQVLEEATAPVVHLVHNERQLRRYNVDPDRTPLVMFNSISLAGAVGWPGRSIVVRPPVFAEDYRVEQTGTAITLVNLMQSKGAGTFFELARAMPDREFLAVVGAYGLQVTPGDVPNVTFLPTQTDAREIYRRTRVLLMPSEYESWGRVGIEAAASGIPTIAHPTPGLLESLAGAGTFVDREDLDGWVDAIEGLDLPYRYAWMSLQARRRSEELDPTEDLDRLEEALVRVVEEHRAGRMGERDPVPAAPGADLVGSVPSDPR